MQNNSQNKISLPVIKRLPRYYRHVLQLQKSGVSTVSSSDLGAFLGTTASQVRQDLNCFGGFGQQGVGYRVDLLASALHDLLIGSSNLSAILIGSGRLGRAISGFLDNTVQGFSLVAAFDNAEYQIGTSLGNLTVQDIAGLSDYCKLHQPQLAVLCIPEKSASAMAPTLLTLGLQGFWNFSHYDFASLAPDLPVENVHLGDSLQSLGFRMRHTDI